MSIANRIVTILVFLAAIAAGVLGYMLFDKRNDAKEKLDTVAAKVSTKTNDLNKSMGKKAVLDPATFAINKDKASVGAGLKTFETSVKDAIEHKKKLADCIADSAEKVQLEGYEEITSAKLLDAKSSQETMDKFIAAVIDRFNADVQFRKDVRDICKDVFLAFDLKEFIDEAKIDADDIAYIKSMFEKVKEVYKKYLETKAEYRSYVGEISGALDMEAVPDSKDLKEVAVDQVQKINELKTDLAAAKKNVKALEQTVASKEEELAQKTKENSALQKKNSDLTADLAKKDKKIATLEKDNKDLRKKASGLGPVTETTTTTTEDSNGQQSKGTPVQISVITPIEKMRTNEGTVVSVYPNQAICVIKLNAIDGKPVTIQKNQYFTLATSLKEDAEITGRVVCQQSVGPNMYQANIVWVASERGIQSGDIVYMTDKDIEETRIANSKKEPAPVDAAPAPAVKPEAKPAPAAEPQEKPAAKPASKDEKKSDADKLFEDDSEDIL